MKEMGIWSGKVPKINPSRIVYDKDVSYINAESSGIFIPEVSIFDRVGKGDTIGTIVNVITGSVEEIITADNDGIICSLREYPVIEEGSLIARILGGEADE